jgi:uncharacterized membrane protein
MDVEGGWLMHWTHELATLVAKLRRRFTRHDFVLALIPVTFLLTAGVAGLLGLSTRTALAGWSVVGLFALADALFLNPPTTGGRAN